MQFAQESDPVRKAKALPRLGEAQFEQVRKEIAAQSYDQALHIVEDYRDEVRGAVAALKSTGVNAERRPSGFKQLQIHLRKSLRELDQTLLALPDDQRPPFESIRQELLSTEKELLDLLFPRKPGKGRSPEKPKG